MRLSTIQPIFRRSIGTLIFADHSGGRLNPAVANAIEAAKHLGSNPIVLIAGEHSEKAAETALKFEEVSKVYFCQDSRYNHNLPEQIAPLIRSIVKDKDLDRIVFLHNALGKNIAPRVASLLDVMHVSDVIRIVSKNTFVRPAYAGNAIMTIKTSDKIGVISIRTTAFSAASIDNESCSASKEEVTAIDSLDCNTVWVKEELSKSERPELGSAKRVVSGGRSFKSKEKFEDLLNPLADTLGAAIGASRAAVDAGYASNALQVGQTGQVVAPDLYVAIGISGAIQHVAGMKDSKVIASINKDADAPIFEISDVGLVADLDQVIPELTELLQHQTK